MDKSSGDLTAFAAAREEAQSVVCAKANKHTAALNQYREVLNADDDTIAAAWRNVGAAEKEYRDARKKLIDICNDEWEEKMAAENRRDILQAQSDGG